MAKAKRRLVMSSLSNLAKFIGVYDKWEQIRKNNGLKWEKRNAIETFLSMLNHNADDTTKWLKAVIGDLKPKYSTVLIYNALTGLRPTEGCNSCRLISTDLENYLDKDLMALQHFKYPKLFLRQSKNAFISFVSKDLLKLVLQNKPMIKYTALTSAIRKKGYQIRVRELRKLYATTLRNNRVPREIIDLLEGRIGQSIFLRFYYKPILQQTRTQVLRAIKPLQKELMETVNN